MGVDAPLQRRHTLLIDPMRLIASVCQDFVENGQKPSSRSLNWEILNDCKSELYKQLSLDFPRLTMVVNGVTFDRSLTAVQCLDGLSVLVGEEAALQILVLTTQGALAPIFNWVHEMFGDDENGTHVTGGGNQEVHVEVDEKFNQKSVEVLLLKAFQVINVTQGEVLPQTDLWCQARLQLAPFQGGEVTLSVPSQQSVSTGQHQLHQSVPIPITEGLLKMRPQHPYQESFALTGDGRWEMVSRQCEC